MKWLELFAGAGGAALGIKAAGGEALACVEWDGEAASTLLAAGFPSVRMDVREYVDLCRRPPPWIPPGQMFPVPSIDVAEVEAIWASFPCQCWSTAGARLGARDPRNGWPWTLEAVDVVGPRWLVAENVSGLLMHSQEDCGDPEMCPGCYFERVILVDLGERFEFVDYRTLNASSYGVPQHRNRVIIVAGPAPIVWPEPTHSGPEEEDGLLPWVTMGQALGLAGFLSGGRNTDANPNQERPRPTTEPAPAIGTKRNQLFEPGWPGEREQTRIIGGGHNPKHAGDVRTYYDITDRPSTTIAAQSGGGAGNAGPFVVKDRPAHCVSASCTLDALTGRRRLTTAECAILQDFPVDHPWKGGVTSIYRQIGNAVPPTLARVVVEALVRADRGETP